MATKEEDHIFLPIVRIELVRLTGSTHDSGGSSVIPLWIPTS